MTCFINSLADLIIFNHVPKNAGSHVRKVLQCEFGSSLYTLYPSTSIPHVSSFSDIRCLVLHEPWPFPQARLAMLFDFISQYSRVFYLIGLRHPLSRLISAVKHSRTISDNGYGFFPYVRHIFGPYDSNAFNSFVTPEESPCLLNPGKRLYTTPSADLVANYLCMLKSPDLIWSYGQSLAASFGNLEAVQNANSSFVNSKGFDVESSQVRECILDTLSLNNYTSVGLVERLNSFLYELVQNGFVSARTLHSTDALSFKTDSVDPIDSDYISNETILNFYGKFPLDFLLWDFFYSSSHLSR